MHSANLTRQFSSDRCFASSWQPAEDDQRPVVQSPQILTDTTDAADGDSLFIF